MVQAQEILNKPKAVARRPFIGDDQEGQGLALAQSERRRRAVAGQADALAPAAHYDTDRTRNVIITIVESPPVATRGKPVDGRRLRGLAPARGAGRPHPIAV